MRTALWFRAASQSRQIVPHAVDVPKGAWIAGGEAAHVQSLNKAMNGEHGARGNRLPDDAFQMTVERSAHAPVPKSAKGLQSPIGRFRNDGVGKRCSLFLRCGDKFLKESGVHQGRIARNHQSPFRTRFPQRAGKPAERPRAREGVREHAMALELRAILPQQPGLPAEGPQHVAEMCKEGALVPGQQRLIPPHPGACSPNQNVTKGHANRMVTLDLQQMDLGNSQFAVKVRTNKLLRICLILMSMFALSQFPLCAAGSSVPSSPESLRSPERTPTPKRRVSTVLVNAETGRLVRVPAGTLLRKSSPATQTAIRAAREAAKQTAVLQPAEIHNLIDKTARKHGVDPKLVHSVVRVESNYEQKAISPKGALGLMQLIPATAARYGVENPFDASQNIDGGVRYLKFLTDRYQGDLQLALAAYNAGEGAVQRHGGVPPYRETREYVTKVTRHLGGSQTMDLTGVSARVPLDLAGNAETLPADKVAAPRETAVRMYTDSEGRLHLESIQ